MALFTVVEETCCTCGVVFGMSPNHKASRQRDRASFYCPNGHAQSYTKSEAERLAEKVKELEEKLAFAIDDLAKTGRQLAALTKRHERLKASRRRARKQERR